MKTLNIKRITALAAGAALLGLGLAFAGPISFQGVPIISNTGQPVVQIVVGSSAQPSDGVAAGNIAAAIGNLAYTTVPVTASVNTAQAMNVLKVSVPSSSYTLSNQEVWLNISSAHAISGAYQFSALIGSVLNRGITLNELYLTKGLQTTTTGGAYADYGPGNYALTYPLDSPYTDVFSGVPTSTTPSASTNGGGITFSGFTSVPNGGDNLVKISNSQLPTLLNNAGQYQESEYLWISGFPVFNQSKTPGSLMLESADGAYQAYFATPIPIHTASSKSLNQPTISLLGKNWTILNYTPPTTPVTSGKAVPGGSIYMAASLSPMETIYVGHNITSGPFTVALEDLGQPNGAGQSPASLNVYYDGKLTNVTQVWPGTTAKLNVTGHNLYINVNSTFAGLYAYQKWAKMQLYSDVINLQSGQQFNKTNDPNWYTILEWTNSTTGTTADALASIIIYGDQAQAKNLQQGQSFQWISQPGVYNLTYLGQSLSPSDFDPVTFTSTSVTNAGEFYQNQGGSSKTPLTIYTYSGGKFSSTSSININETAINESAQLLTIKSSIPNAFSTNVSKTST
ncbi:MAG: S-layer protein, partial [Candidatus Micrarchaeia archaeon]